MEIHSLRRGSLSSHRRCLLTTVNWSAPFHKKRNQSVADGAHQARANPRCLPAAGLPRLVVPLQGVKDSSSMPGISSLSHPIVYAGPCPHGGAAGSRPAPRARSPLRAARTAAWRRMRCAATARNGWATRRSRSPSSSLGSDGFRHPRVDGKRNTVHPVGEPNTVQAYYALPL